MVCSASARCGRLLPGWLSSAQLTENRVTLDAKVPHSMSSTCNPGYFREAVAYQQPLAQLDTLTWHSPTTSTGLTHRFATRGTQYLIPLIFYFCERAWSTFCKVRRGFQALL